MEMRNRMFLMDEGRGFVVRVPSRVDHGEHFTAVSVAILEREAASFNALPRQTSQS
jgi:hypothetical protein